MTGAPLRINRVVHTNARVAFKPLAMIAPDVKTQRTDGGEGEVMAIAFQDDDGDVHVFVLDDARVEKLKKDLLGGIAPVSAILRPH